MDKLNLTVIVPLNTWDGEVIEYLDRALDCVAMQGRKPENILLLISDDVRDNSEFPEYFKKNKTEFKTLGMNLAWEAASGETFQEQLNTAVKNIRTEYFSICDYSDWYGQTWFENVKRYIDQDKDIDLFIPVVIAYDTDSNFVRFFNEQYLAMGFTGQELGYVNEEALKTMYEMWLHGSVINTSTFIKTGGLKPSIKTYYWYEFLLRWCYNKGIPYVIPKNGYNHVLMPEPQVDVDELKFYYTTSQSEYVFINDRNKVYQPKKSKTDSQNNE
jgi:hypothetical protein